MSDFSIRIEDGLYTSQEREVSEMLTLRQQHAAMQMSQHYLMVLGHQEFSREVSTMVEDLSTIIASRNVRDPKINQILGRCQEIYEAI